MSGSGAAPLLPSPMKTDLLQDKLQKRNQWMVALCKIPLHLILCKICVVCLENQKDPLHILFPFGSHHSRRRDGIIAPIVLGSISAAVLHSLHAKDAPCDSWAVTSAPSSSSRLSSEKEASASSLVECSEKNRVSPAVNCELWRQQLTAVITERCSTGMHQSSQQVAGSSMKLISAPLSISSLAIAN